MKNFDVLNTLFVGIDVSARTNVCFGMNFNQDEILSISVPNNQVGAESLKLEIITAVAKYRFKAVAIALESTSFYGVHIANFLSSDEDLMPLNVYVYCLNPKTISNYRKSFIGLEKTDPMDAYIIADFARVGRIHQEPWRGSQLLALQRLTRHRLHIVECITREKAYMVSNIFLKFSELAVLGSDGHPFSSNHTATAEAILTEMLNPEELCDMSTEDLVDFVCVHSKSHYADPKAVGEILQKAARDSYRLDKVLYEPLTVSIAASFNCIAAYQKEMQIIGKAIEKAIKGLFPSDFQVLQSIPGIGPVFAAGILAEIGDVHAFHSSDALAKYAGIYWPRSQSGNFEAEDKHLSKSGNKFLRYYIIEATNSIRRHDPVFAEHYRKKYDETTTHQHKRALALTSKKTIRLIYGLLAKHQLYSVDRVQTE